MLGFEVKVMIIGVGSKAYLFYFGDLALGLHLLFFLLLIVEEFVVVNDLANRRIDGWRNFYQVQTLVLCHLHRGRCIIDTWFNILTYQTHLGNPDKMIDTVFCFFAGNKPSPETAFIKSATAGPEASA